MSEWTGLRGYLELWRVIGPGTGWVWLTLGLACAGAVLWWYYRWSRPLRSVCKLRDVLVPMGLMVLGVIMLTLPGWRGLDSWLNAADYYLLSCLLPVHTVWRNAVDEGAGQGGSLTDPFVSVRDLRTPEKGVRGAHAPFRPQDLRLPGDTEVYHTLQPTVCRD